MRGEHDDTRLMLIDWGGSSPHARGTLLALKPAFPPLRFIPACAGNTTGSVNFSRNTAVHPRMRGEHLQRNTSRVVSYGSSPHARGTHTAPRVQAAAGRFIPACAGNTFLGHALLRAQAVHPRMRGEHASVCARNSSSVGSSPHARGTQHTHQHRQAKQRFIPACAGNTSAVATTIAAISVHPRMRGEHVPRLGGNQRLHGSSPHARGTLMNRIKAKGAERFIPACAGNTRPLSNPSHRPSGSSPHARGTRALVSRHPHRHRFIPACAGNTPACSPICSASTVHPRMRGEHSSPNDVKIGSIGSSPHARGTQL